MAQGQTWSEQQLSAVMLNLSHEINRTKESKINFNNQNCDMKAKKNKSFPKVETSWENDLKTRADFYWCGASSCFFPGDVFGQEARNKFLVAATELINININEA